MVVKNMDIGDRKYYGETILNLMSNSMLKKTLLITALMLISGFAISYSILPNKTIEEKDSFAVYIKEDGLYYSYLDNMAEIKIHEGKEFIYPLISEKGSYIAYTKGKSFYIYDIKNKEYEKIADNIEHYYTSYDWIDDETIVYSTESPGFTIYNASTKIRKEHLDEYHYANLRSDNKNTIYGIKMSKWTAEEGDFAANNGVVEINLKDYDSKNKAFPINTIIKSRETTDETIGYNPIIWDITGDGKYIYIMEKPASGSLSTDGIGVGIYDVEKKEHRELTDITLLPYKDNLSINPRNNDLIALIQGPGREMIFYKEVILLNINEDKTFKTVNFMDKDLVAMTPSFTLDGKKLLFSAARGQIESRGFDYNKAFEDWEVQPHHIYEYDLKTSEVRKVTEGDGFDFMPISISKDSILFSRYKGKGYHSLIKLVNGKEQILADNIIIDYELEGLGFGFYGHSNTEKGIDIYLNERKNENNGITPNHPIEDVLSKLEKKEFYIQGENISNADNEVIVEFGKAFVNLFNGAVGKQKKVSFEKYISNKNLQRFTDKMLVLTQIQDLQGGNDVNYGLENEFKQGKLQYIEENLYYLELPFQFKGSGMTAKMLITSQNKILKLVDFYFGTKDGVDTFATGHPAERKIRDPKLWENEDWVRDVFIKLKDFEKGLEAQNGIIQSTKNIDLKPTIYEVVNNFKIDGEIKFLHLFLLLF